MLISKIQKPIAFPIAMQILAISGFAVLTGLGARVTIPLPFTPVPFTLQVLCVLLSGLVLGAKRGAISQVVYLAAITAGLPLDARAMGPAVWLTPTAGYLAGFVAAAFVSGWVAERVHTKSLVTITVAGAAGIAVLYTVGAGWLTLFFLHGDVMKGILLGIAPFLMVDLIKAAIAAVIALSYSETMRRLPGA